ncbi:hypothetical protein PGTUg99_013577 [Puccinia graminis f. sp. tritici]|uniref:Uncharacterized protein n=1 Tax=Puccinia graminis f. sp. tritici TaxID=56615 RepID=A0A5B0LTC4_PUCGR|nr:hypothetical protein PGTUg99_013577 [Puccinia graminis f. sp. tritici]
MHFSNFSNLLSVIFMLLIVIAGATGLFTCSGSQYGYCTFEDRLTIPINYAFGPAYAPSRTVQNRLSLTCQYSQLPIGTPKGTCCDKSVGEVFLRDPDDPLIVYYNDYIKAGCHEAVNTN